MKRQFDVLTSSAIYSALNLLSFVLIARGVETATFGAWALFISLCTFVDNLRFGITRDATIKIIHSDSKHNSFVINAGALRIELEVLAITSVMFLSIAVVSDMSMLKTFSHFLIWYPLIGISNTLWHNAIAWLEAKLKFRNIISLRIINIVSFITFVLILLHNNIATLQNLTLAYAASNAISSLLCLMMGWSSAKYIFKANVNNEKQILELGKKTYFGNIGTSFLKTTDILIISLSPIFGLVGVAVYTIPLKIIEFLEFPIRAALKFLSEHLARAAANYHVNAFKKLETYYISLVTIIIIPIIILIAVFPDSILDLVGADIFIEHSSIMKSMLFVMLGYGFLLIPERFISMSLDSVGKNSANAIRIFCILILNILGDIIAIFVFSSIFGVVFATTASALLGVIVGYFMIPKTLRADTAFLIEELRKSTSKLRTFLSKR